MLVSRLESTEEMEGMFVFSCSDTGPERISPAEFCCLCAVIKKCVLENKVVLIWYYRIFVLLYMRAK